SSARDDTRSLRKIAARWFATVRGEIDLARAISAFDWPATTPTTIDRSAGLSIVASTVVIGVESTRKLSPRACTTKPASGSPAYRFTAPALRDRARVIARAPAAR